MSSQVKIDAWIYDPKYSLIKGTSKRHRLFELFCQQPETCDLLQKESSCLHCGALSPCKFGTKRETEGPTPRASSFQKTIRGWKEDNEGYLNKLGPLKAYNRIFKTHGHFYMPYSFMTGCKKSPLTSKWVQESDLTTDLLDSICTARPEALFGGVIKDYQEKEVPKLIADLHAHYPDVFELLPDEQKRRFDSTDYTGRTADITTCAPGNYVFSKRTWRWDGEHLHGDHMLFAPAKGDLHITIKPDEGSPVQITDNSQVAASTRFLD